MQSWATEKLRADFKTGLSSSEKSRIKWGNMYVHSIQKGWGGMIFLDKTTDSLPQAVKLRVVRFDKAKNSTMTQ